MKEFFQVINSERETISLNERDSPFFEWFHKREIVDEVFVHGECETDV